MKKDLIDYFLKYKCSNKTLIDLELIYEYYSEREEDFEKYLQALLVEARKPNNLLVLNGFCNLLMDKYPNTSRDFMAMKKVTQYKNDAAQN